MKLSEFTVGQEFTTKSFKLTQKKIMEFAKDYDPQYMHLDEEKANQGRFNGIIASGIQTLAISFKLWIEEGKYGDDIIAGTRMNNIKFTQAVYPDDELYTVVKVIDIKERKIENGILTVTLTTFNHKEVKVFEGDLSVLLKNDKSTI
ncbi:MAG TPA: MaoC/PaaZ C-terminal domain-containing protein [Pseudogracilibacillus sp.]|nr:MaoC/PaaZ C-terminal domain-containing protein [Pseudogracilibacillus sp.]